MEKEFKIGHLIGRVSSNTLECLAKHIWELYIRTKVTSVDAIFLEHLYKEIIEELERRKESRKSGKK